MNECVIKFAREISKEYNVSTSYVYDIVMDEHERINKLGYMPYEEVITHCKDWIAEYEFENRAITPFMIAKYCQALLFFGSLKSVKRSI